MSSLFTAKHRYAWLLRVLPILIACSCAAIVKKDYFTGDLINVPHAKHGQNDVACIACHEEVYDSKTLEGNSYRPLESKCMECHQDKKDAGQCAMCHTDPKKPSAYPKRERLIHINHQKHISDVKEIGEKCEVCHKALPEPNRSRAAVPSMDTCTDCHNHREDYKEGRCDKCHVDLTRYPLKPVADFTHNGNFVADHGRLARSKVDSCALCHEQTFCADCHAKTTGLRVELKSSERVDRDFIHRNDWLGRHSMEAQYDQEKCKRCHGTSFCESCHTSQGLSSRSLNPKNPHPAGYAFPGSAKFHAEDARRDITACASCHDQGAQSNCVSCHKVGAIGGNPHPMGWTDKHPSSEISRNSMCRYCHQ